MTVDNFPLYQLYRWQHSREGSRVVYTPANVVKVIYDNHLTDGNVRPYNTRTYHDGYHLTLGIHEVFVTPVLK